MTLSFNNVTFNLHVLKDFSACFIPSGSHSRKIYAGCVDQTQSYFHRLGSDIVRNLALYLELPCFSAFSNSCKKFHNLLSKQSLWKIWAERLGIEIPLSSTKKTTLTKRSKVSLAPATEQEIDFHKLVREVFLKYMVEALNKALHPLSPFTTEENHVWLTRLIAVKKELLGDQFQLFISADKVLISNMIKATSNGKINVIRNMFKQRSFSKSLGELVIISSGFGQLALVRELMKQGTISGKDLGRALLLAHVGMHKGVCAELIKHATDDDFYNEMRGGLLAGAIPSGSEAIVRLILSSGPISAEHRATALFGATLTGNLQLVNLISTAQLVHRSAAPS